jgi:hypothetical protein
MRSLKREKEEGLANTAFVGSNCISRRIHRKENPADLLIYILSGPWRTSDALVDYHSFQ